MKGKIMEDKKYELPDETIEINGHTLHRKSPKGLW